MDKFVYEVSCFLDNGCRVEPVSKTVISKRQLKSEEIQNLVRSFYNGYDETVYGFSIIPVVFLDNPYLL